MANNNDEEEEGDEEERRSSGGSGEEASACAAAEFFSFVCRLLITNVLRGGWLLWLHACVMRTRFFRS